MAEEVNDAKDLRPALPKQNKDASMRDMEGGAG